MLPDAYSVSVLVLCLAVGVQSESLSRALLQQKIPEIDEFLEAYIACKNVSGLALAITLDQEVVVSKGYGLADLNSGQPVDGDTVFGIASLTKAFTSALLAAIIEESEGWVLLLAAITEI